MAVDLRDFEFFAGTQIPVVGATVRRRAASLTQPNTAGAVQDTTTTNGSGMWEFVGVADGLYDIEIEYNGKFRYRAGYAAFSNLINVGQLQGEILLANVADATPDDTYSVSGTPTNAEEMFDKVAALFKRLLGTAAWTAAPAESIAAIWAKFHDSTGHTHAGSGSAGGQVSHTNLSNKGTNTHTQLDSHVAASAQVHGLATSVHVLGSIDGAGRLVDGAVVSTGGESAAGAFFYSTVSWSYATAFSAAPVVLATGVYDPATKAAWVQLYSLGTSGVTVAVVSTATGHVASRDVNVLAYGVP